MGLKVLMIGAYPLESGMVRGGVEAVTETLVSALARRDDIDSVTVLRFHRGDAPTHHRRDGPKVEIHYVRGQQRLRNMTASFLDVRKARRLITRIRPDVVHGHEIGADGDIATRCSRNGLVTVHGITYVEAQLYDGDSLLNRLRAGLIRNVARRVLRRAKVVISISKYDTDELAALVHGERVSIANPVAPEFFGLAPSIPTDPKVLFAGALIPLKNPLGLVNAFVAVRDLLPKARLALIGPQPDNDYLNTIKHRVNELGLADSVDIVDLIDTERLRREIAAARVVVLFSRQENAPTIIAQAMAAGKPVIASRVGGIAEMVNDGDTGFVVESGDEAGLADRLVTLLEDQDLCLRMGRRAHEVATKHFAPEAVAETTVQAYKKALRQEVRTWPAHGPR